MLLNWLKRERKKKYVIIYKAAVAILFVVVNSLFVDLILIDLLSLSSTTTWL
jgi:hypothetical protein